MKRVLTGIQSSGKPHLGNILGAILPAIELSRDQENECFFFIADLHSMTTIKDPNQRLDNILSIAAAWLAFGFDISKNVIYRQSHVVEVCELTWYLSCFMPFGKLNLAHSFKDKSDKLSDVNAGLFTYPVLMCADMLLYDAEIIPVGKDQKQHIEFAKDIARRINFHYEKEIFILPNIKLDDKVMTVPGVDGQKMSKSYNNYIDVFQGKKKLKKSINTIITDLKTLEEPKDPNTCNIFKIYQSVANEDQIEDMKNKYLAGNYGYGHAKNELLDVLWEKFKDEREKYDYYMNNPDVVEDILQEGEERARVVAKDVINRARHEFGFIRG